MCKSWRASPLPTPRFLPSRDDGNESSAHCLGFGEKRAFLPGNRAVSAQRPGLGEKRLFQTTDRPTKPQVKSLLFSAALPGQDLVPPALSQARTLRTIEGNSCLWRPFFSQAGTMCRRNPPKQERCAATERSSASGTHLSPQNARSHCPEAALRGFFVRAGGGVSGSGAYW